MGFSINSALRYLGASEPEKSLCEQQRLSVIRALRCKLSKTFWILFQTWEAWRARTRMFLKIFSRRKRRAVSVICPAARVGLLLAHNAVPTQWKTHRKNWRKLQKLQLPLIKHTNRNHTALIDRWKKRQGRKLKMQILCWRSLIQASIHPKPERGGGWIVLNCAGEYDVMLGKIFRAQRLGWESLRLEVMKNPYTHTQRGKMHSYTVWKQPPNHNLTFMIKNTHRLGLQTIVAHQTLFINTHMYKNSLGSFWKHWWSHHHLWSKCFDRAVGVSEDKTGRTAEGKCYNWHQHNCHDTTRAETTECLSFRLSHSGNSRDSSKQDFDLDWVISDLFWVYCYQISMFVCFFTQSGLI